jgi:hypothetical protein
VSNFNFTYQSLKKEYMNALDQGYQIINCIDYFDENYDLQKKVIVNRVDVDFSLKKTQRILKIFNDLEISATFFIRLHAPEYNPFSFEGFKILKLIRDSGHEIGYHSEVVDQSMIWSEPSEDCLKRDLDVLSRMLGIQVRGVASHGGMTGLNNLDFWKDREPADFDLTYEAYRGSKTSNLFENSLYVSDSEWTRWKCYRNGKLSEMDNRCLSEHLIDCPKVVYFLIHPDTFFDHHFYE